MTEHEFYETYLADIYRICKNSMSERFKQYLKKLSQDESTEEFDKIFPVICYSIIKVWFSSYGVDVNIGDLDGNTFELNKTRYIVYPELRHEHLCELRQNNRPTVVVFSRMEEGLSLGRLPENISNYITEKGLSKSYQRLLEINETIYVNALYTTFGVAINKMLH